MVQYIFYIWHTTDQDHVIGTDEKKCNGWLPSPDHEVCISWTHSLGNNKNILLGTVLYLK